MINPTSLDEWLQRLEQMQPNRIELGLSRVLQVGVLAGLDKPDFKIVTVAGTNGKGSTVAYVAELLSIQNLSIGVYTSPHFVDFNERIVVDGQRISAHELCQAFSRIDQVRGDIELTYFEFTTLVAIHCFSQRNVDVAVLEVGLGGRLDAVNAWDSQVACVTSIGVDHVDWLGDDRGQIGIEKASIARPDCALVCGDHEPPRSIASTTTEIGARLLQIGKDFEYQRLGDQWLYRDAEVSLSLPLPAIHGDWVLSNVSVAICATRQLLGYYVSESAIASVVRKLSIAGRMQLVDYQSITVLLDVAHNVDAAGMLSKYLCSHPVSGKTTAVFSCMQDKDIDAILQKMQLCIDSWCIAELELPRAVESSQLTGALGRVGADPVDVFATVTTAFEQAIAQSSIEDRVVVFGSFHVVGPILSQLAENQPAQ